MGDTHHSVPLCLPVLGELPWVVHSSNTMTELSYTRYEYLWEDGVRYKRPTKLPAPEYVDALMNWAQNILDDEAVFPNTIGTSFC
jgi:Mob1/phocein family